MKSTMKSILKEANSLPGTQTKQDAHDRMFRLRFGSLANNPSYEYLLELHKQLAVYMDEVDAWLVKHEEMDSAAIENAVDEHGEYFEGADMGKCRKCSKRAPLSVDTHMDGSTGMMDGMCPKCFAAVEDALAAVGGEEE